jgi:hypothetical protein
VHGIGTPTHKLQRLGDWKTTAVVERYAHVAPEGRLQNAANRLDEWAATTFGYATKNNGLGTLPKPLFNWWAPTDSNCRPTD